jgi:hypothetical protein
LPIKAYGPKTKEASMSVLQLVDHSNNAAHISPVEALQRVIAEHEPGGELEGRKKLIVISLDDEGGYFDVTFRNAGVSCSDIMAALRITEYKILKAMGYVD